MNIYLDSLHLLLLIGCLINAFLYLHERSHHKRTQESMVNFLEANNLIVYEEEED
jgi:hypothetical protein